MKLRRVAESVVLIGMLAVLIYGFVFFPDAPIKPCQNASGFCGKSGLVHTQRQFDDFNLWQTILLVTWAVGMPGLLVLRLIGKKPGAVQAKKPPLP